MYLVLVLVLVIVIVIVLTIKDAPILRVRVSSQIPG